jgi:hypothetical protein
MSIQASFMLRGRNPDVLTCIANLSNDEVFTRAEASLGRSTSLKAQKRCLGRAPSRDESRPAIAGGRRQWRLALE